MNAYVDYEFYVVNYDGHVVKEERFQGLALKATQYIRYITLGRSDNYLGIELKYAACEVIDAYSRGSEKEKRSENNDGYSVTFVTDGRDGETSEELMNRKAYQAAKKWLTGTGLLSRKVGCSCDC